MSKVIRKKFFDEIKEAHATIIRDLGDVSDPWVIDVQGKKYSFHPGVTNNYDLRKEYADHIITEALTGVASEITHVCSAECYDNEESPCQRCNPWYFVDIMLDLGVNTRRRIEKKVKPHVISSMATKTPV